MPLEPLTYTRRSGDGTPTLRVEAPPPPPLDPREDRAGREAASPARADAREKVTGRAQFTCDVRLPGQLHAVVLRSPHAHARIRAIDTRAARALPGVHDVIDHTTALGIGWYEEDVPLLADRVRFAGDEVACVAAETQEQAERAARAIVVDYEVLGHVLGLDAALADGAPAVHGGGNRMDEPQCYRRGRGEAALAGCEVVVERTFHTPTAVHNALEPHVTTAYWEGEQLVLHDSTQGIFAVRDGVAGKLGLPQHSVRVVSQYMGGGFGAKQIPWKQAVFAAILARRTGRPVQAMLDREAENLAAGNRGATRQHVRLGANARGELEAIVVDVLIDAGAYNTGGEGSDVAGIYQRLYACPNVSTRQQRIYTNTGPAVAFRAPGYVEGAFALESAMDELARRVDVDPVTVRLRNYATVDQLDDEPYSSPEALRRCIDAVTRAAGFGAKHEASRRGRDARSATTLRGIGLAAHAWQGGSTKAPAYATVKLNPDASVELRTGTQDIGTGTRTVLAQAVARELSVDSGRVRVHLGDTAGAGYAPTSAGSYTVPTMIPAVRAAAADARRHLLAAAAAYLERDAAGLALAGGHVVAGSNAAPLATLEDITAALAPALIEGHGAWHDPGSSGRSVRTFGAHVAEVEVDTATGEIRVLALWCAPDCGRILNDRLAASQIIGGVTQGIGFALMEQRRDDARRGWVLNAQLEDYLIPTQADVLRIHPVTVGDPDADVNPSGAKGLGELPLIAAAPAIANAVFDATGIRFPRLPITPARVLDALAGGRPTPARGEPA